ncbi:MAG: hypothetical protein GWN99_00605 [Gemmatimonadetes bacterium]|uniref:FIMAH domain-containing protein n=1 Tax=Candidatus Kutchimonas denitrificans TaxID=3056748 RepID=A0AAE5CAQ9_9BACT|nr:hypothetical protein [Gemmatimonadota bacterium]NIR73608.1 hypothetical protein [Candidatus Kutchimonas denitrificans]NIR99567.1 hypothetical protein [Gemmatimonadota bacterium]NIT65187.1 hypothetical protein [Gemmatimonadota bacterium]NIV23720.1 hypothetical protein [Gemmatimonadota bacterium]
MRTLAPLAILALVPGCAIAQGTPGTNIDLRVEVSSVDVEDGVTRVEYVLFNEPSSEEELFEFIVEAPAPVLSISQPEPRSGWVTGTAYRGISVAQWSVLEPLMPPGAQSPPLSFEAEGLPAIVTYHARGFFPVPEYEPVPPRPPDAEPVLFSNTVEGKTVGVEPTPPESGPGDLMARGLTVLDQVCGLDWIDAPGVCNSLRVKLEGARASMAAGRIKPARGQLRAFLNELEAQRGRHVSESAYQLLAATAIHIGSAL